MTEDEVRSTFIQHEIVPPTPDNPGASKFMQSVQACIAQGSNELRNALEACVELMSTLPTLNGFYGLAVLEHARGLLELLPITDDVTEGMVEAGRKALYEPALDDAERVQTLYSTMRAIAPRRVEPVDMLLWCPACGTQHIDAPNGDWQNPPHRSHLCAHCSWQWRPSDTPTNGVAALHTAGKHDGPSDPTRASFARAYMARRGYFAIPPQRPGDLWAVGTGSARASQCHFGPTLYAAIAVAQKEQPHEPTYRAMR